MHKIAIKYVIYFFCMIMTLVLYSCIDKIDLNIPAGEDKIVIEGFITNGPGPYQVKISRSAAVFNSETDVVPPGIEGARVTISDDTGFLIELLELGPGVYQTNDTDFVGEIGKSYTLTAIIDEKSYTSTSEVMEPVPDLADLYYEWREERYFNENNIELIRYFFDVFVDINNTSSKSQRVRFDWEGVYEFETNPKDRTLALGAILDPPLCSGYIVEEKQLVQIDYCQCCTCWGTVFSPATQAEQIPSGNFKKRIRVASIPVDPFHFQRKFQVKVFHYSISEKAYNFWNLMEEQQSISGGIFDTPLGKLRGNISNISNPEEEVLGFFGASAVIENSFFLHRDADVKANIEQINVAGLTFPCDEWDAPNSTTEKPSDW